MKSVRQRFFVVPPDSPRPGRPSDHKAGSNSPAGVSCLLTALIFLCGPFAATHESRAVGSAEELAVSGVLSDIAIKAFSDTVSQIPLAPAPVSAEVSIGGGALKVYFVTVGQGDAEYIELPNGRNVLIDGGPARMGGGPAGGPSSGDPPIAQFLNRKGVTKLDYVVLSHPHADHYTGLKYVFSKLPVANFYDTQLDTPAPSGVKAVREQARNVPGIKIFYPAPGDSLDWDPNVQVKVFNSCPAPSNTRRDPNSCSIVLKMTYQNTSVLFTGDMPAKVEAMITEKYDDQLRSYVLKVGHHGSAGSSSEVFLKVVQPKLAFIEVGAGNSYGHPRPEALARLQAAGATIYRTDLDGTLEYPVGGVPQFQSFVYTWNPAPSQPWVAGTFNSPSSQ